MWFHWLSGSLQVSLYVFICFILSRRGFVHVRSQVCFLYLCPSVYMHAWCRVLPSLPPEWCPSCVNLPFIHLPVSCLRGGRSRVEKRKSRRKKKKGVIEDCQKWKMGYKLSTDEGRKQEMLGKKGLTRLNLKRWRDWTERLDNGPMEKEEKIRAEEGIKGSGECSFSLSGRDSLSSVAQLASKVLD